VLTFESRAAVQTNNNREIYPSALVQKSSVVPIVFYESKCDQTIVNKYIPGKSHRKKINHFYNKSRAKNIVLSCELGKLLDRHGILVLLVDLKSLKICVMG